MSEDQRPPDEPEPTELKSGDLPGGADDSTRTGGKEDANAAGNGLPGKRIGDFELLSELGRGGMGVVYEARQVSLNRRVALKVLPPGLGLTDQAVKRFEREAHAAAKLHHTNIVPVHATGEEAGCHYYAMELIEGQPLSEVLRDLTGQGSNPLMEETVTKLGGDEPDDSMSFAQMEREVAAERTRHKIEAARRRGKWTGGRPVLGYDVVDSKLVINNEEAQQVKAIFEMYAERPSMTATARELNRRGWRQKRWTTKRGTEAGGGTWNKPSLRTLLRNPLYAGMQKLGDETFKGEHKAIVTKKLFDRVQRLMAGNRRDRGAQARNSHGFLLRGLLRCAACDAPMTADSPQAHGRRYRYDRCLRSQKNGAASCPTRSVQADRIEQLIVDEIRRIGADPELQQATFDQAVAQVKAQRRGLKREKKQLERDLASVRGDSQRFVGALARADGPAAVAIQTELATAQERITTLEARMDEITTEMASLDPQAIDRADLARALEEFDPIWDVLLTPEKERLLRLLIDRIDYDGGGGKLSIAWRLAGFGQLAEDVAT
jgi:site-specific DNA recombinase